MVKITNLSEKKRNILTNEIMYDILKLPTILTRFQKEVSRCIIDGSQFLNMDDHYEIIFFSSYHEVWVRRYTRFDREEWQYCDPDDFQEGETIGIGHTQ